MNYKNQNIPVQRTIRRLGFWRFMLALMMGLGTWWGIGWILDPSPLWRIDFDSGKTFYMPLSEDESGHWLPAYELRQQTQQGIIFSISSFIILDANNGSILYRLPIEDELWGSEQYYDVDKAQPRIIGNTLWRITHSKNDKTDLIELRAWCFTQDHSEKIIHTWKVSTGSRMKFAFDSSTSPYLITQYSPISFLLEPMLIGFGADGWSRLLFLLSCLSPDNLVPSNLPVAPTEQLDNVILELSYIQTWKLSDSG